MARSIWVEDFTSVELVDGIAIVRLETDDGPRVLRARFPVAVKATGIAQAAIREYMAGRECAAVVPFSPLIHGKRRRD